VEMSDKSLVVLQLLSTKNIHNQALKFLTTSALCLPLFHYLFCQI
jgi:hypothetical protein